jgi:hypothetical protein
MMNSQATLLSSLQLNYLTNNLTIWYYPEQKWLISDPSIINSLVHCGSSHPKPRVQLLKSGLRRNVVRIDTRETSLVIKSFPFTRLREKFKYKKYGLAEITNNMKARQLGIPTPRYYAYYESRQYGLVTANGCIMNFLYEYMPLEKLYKQDKQLIYMAIPVLVELFNTGVNHIDISPANIFFSDDKTDFKIIDWQYCSFHTPNDPLQLAVQAAHFLRGTDTGLDSDLQTEWLDQLYQSSNPEIPKSSFMAAVSSMKNIKLSIKDRLALNFDRDALFNK